MFEMSSKVIKFPTIGMASFGQIPYNAHHLPVQGVVGITLIGALFIYIHISSGWLL